MFGYYGVGERDSRTSRHNGHFDGFASEPAAAAGAAPKTKASPAPPLSPEELAHFGALFAKCEALATAAGAESGEQRSGGGEDGEDAGFFPRLVRTTGLFGGSEPRGYRHRLQGRMDLDDDGRVTEAEFLEFMRCVRVRFTPFLIVS